MGESDKKDIPMRTLAEALGVSATMISKYKKQGCPLTSIEEAQKWKDEHHPAPNKLPKIKIEQADIDKLELNDPRFSDSESLKRALLNEFKAGELVQAAIKSGNTTLIRQAIQIQGEAQKTRTQQKAAYFDLQEREGSLIKAEWVIARDKQLFDSINKMLDQLPAELAARVETLDPIKAKGQATELINDLKSKIVERLEKERDLA